MPWEKGQSGNPKGRPRKGNTLTEALENEFSPEELAIQLRKLAFEHDNFPALRYIFDRVEGTPRQFIEMENPKEAALLEYFRRVDSEILREAGCDIPELSTEPSEDTDT